MVDLLSASFKPCLHCCLARVFSSFSHILVLFILSRGLQEARFVVTIPRVVKLAPLRPAHPPQPNPPKKKEEEEKMNKRTR